jgi:hypothetical protein
MKTIIVASSLLFIFIIAIVVWIIFFVLFALFVSREIVKMKAASVATNIDVVGILNKKEFSENALATGPNQQVGAPTVPSAVIWKTYGVTNVL